MPNNEKQREQVVAEPIESCSACAGDTVRVLAREAKEAQTPGSDRMGGENGKGAMP